ncbi:contractile injection system protein, VgrG/Pvc8 family [uncultured Acinetobacter sp.]|uniref:contractile injection system protein, VgrG/Pvc8 family n=1 Tax=uncultured Acinetobacter sp. TaxID=165433 RepID=UPI00258F1858|nr:contractile injection system protein, VgrG/Pvc8 family [uncultured Acinetobacter sp.]
MSVLSQVQAKYSSLNNYPSAIYRVTVNDVDISSHLASRLISMTIQDNRGMVADSVDITLDDSDQALEIPSVGAEMKVWLGWSDTGLIYKGSYLVTGGSHSGSPDTLHISAESTDLAESFRQKRERSFHQVTLQEIFQSIAFDYKLKLVVHASLANRTVSHIDQNDSDANIMTRLADENDAIATVKNGTLLLLPIGESQTASGLDLPAIELIRSEGDQHSYSYGQSNDKIECVKAFYYPPKKGEKLYVIVGTHTDNPKEIRFIHRDKKTAELAALAELKRCKRNEESLTFTLAKGRADLIPEQQFTFTGLKTQIDEIIWLGKTITHDLNESSGYTTRIELELQLPNADDVSTLFDDNTKLDKEEKQSREAKSYADYTGVKAWYETPAQKAKRKKSTTKSKSQVIATSEVTKTLDVKPKTDMVMIGDQRNPKVMVKTYKSRASAVTAIKREYARILTAQKQAKKVEA